MHLVVALLKEYDLQCFENASIITNNCVTLAPGTGNGPISQDILNYLVYRLTPDSLIPDYFSKPSGNYPKQLLPV